MATKKPKQNQVRIKTYKVESRASKLAEELLSPEKSKNSQLEDPPVPLSKLASLVELSSTLNPFISAYVTNIASRGYRFHPSIDLNSEDAVDKVRDSMLAEELVAAMYRKDDLGSISPPEIEEVNERIDTTRKQARLELALSKAFFSCCVPGSNFTSLCEKMIQDKEALGNSYCEVLRGAGNKPRNLVYVEAHKIRIGKIDPDDVGVNVKTIKRTTDISFEKVNVHRTFLKFAQVDDAGRPAVWFKEFGDPRIMSRDTGSYYSSLDAMKAKEKDAEEATELLHDKIHCSTSVYGVPRWFGNVPAVLGSRELDETNLDYFNSNAIPALALLVSGGSLKSGADEKLREFFERTVAGRRSTHKLVVLEAMAQQRAASTSPNPNPKLEFVPLRTAQVQDALFQEYDDKNIKKIAQSFRLHLSIIGKEPITVEELRFAEEQVYSPGRDDFNALINDNLLPALGIFFWTFGLKATPIRDPNNAGKLVISAAKEGIIVPAEARAILGEILSVEFPSIRAVWTAQPIPFTMAILGIKAGPAEAVREQGRQAGVDSPIDRLLSELGVGTENRAVADLPEDDSSSDDSTEEEEDNDDDRVEK